MNIRLIQLAVRTRQTVEEIYFSDAVTFLYGPVGTGKSTVARMIDFCLGGDLERTPAVQREFVSVSLVAKLGENTCTLERGASDSQAVRVTWTNESDVLGSVNAPIVAGDTPLTSEGVYGLSDLLFFLCSTEPIKVPKRTHDPDSPMVRLSFRDLWRYCYLDQAHLDSSFFRMEDPFRGRKSQDAMRFFTGLHSEALSQLQSELYRAIADQQGAKEAASQIREFMSRFNLGSEIELSAQIDAAESRLHNAQALRRTLEAERSSSIHPTDELRARLRQLSKQVSDLQGAVADSEEILEEQMALYAEFVTSKVKADRAGQADVILSGVAYTKCPRCGADVSDRVHSPDHCCLCGTPSSDSATRLGTDAEVVRRELNDRIDQIADSITRRKEALKRSKRELRIAERAKGILDRQLEDELHRYDSAFIESVRAVDRSIASLEERIRSLQQLQEMPRAIGELEERAGASVGVVERLRAQIEEERLRLRSGDFNASAIANRFKSIMLDVGFPGVSPEDEVILDTRNWRPAVVHAGQQWGFWDTGSGGKKTLYNVCYALAVHEVARERDLPVPTVLIIDSPTKNISDDENPDLVEALYQEIFRFAAAASGGGTQILLIDSNLVEPQNELPKFAARRMAGEPDAPSLISYYHGP